MVIHSYTWLYTAIHGYTQLYTAIHGYTQLYTAIHSYLTIILRGRAGYRMIDNQRGA